jgi:hypothetical protein
MEASKKTAEALRRAIEVAMKAGRPDIADRLTAIARKLPQRTEDRGTEPAG